MKIQILLIIYLYGSINLLCTRFCLYLSLTVYYNVETISLPLVSFLFAKSSDHLFIGGRGFSLLSPSNDWRGLTAVSYYRPTTNKMETVVLYLCVLDWLMFNAVSAIFQPCNAGGRSWVVTYLDLVPPSVRPSVSLFLSTMVAKIAGFIFCVYLLYKYY